MTVITRGRREFWIKDRIGRLVHKIRHRFLDRDSRKFIVPLEQKKVLSGKNAGLSSPIRRLPAELLLIIFDYACEHNKLESKGRSSKSSFPLSLIPALSISSTCIRWNSIADSAPEIWSRLALEIACHSPRRVAAFAEIVRLFLVRSANHLLTINLHLAGNDQAIFSPVMNLLLQHSQRWRVLQYNGDMSIGGHIPRGFQFNELREVSLRHYGGEPLEAFALAPKLHKIHALAMLFINPSALHLFNHITSLDTSVYSFDDLVDHCSNLTTLTLWAHKGRHIGSRTQNPRRLPHLLVLRLRLCSWAQENDLLEYILLSFSCPVLTEVHVVMHLNKDLSCLWPHQLFARFLSDSSCQITKLALLGMRISAQDLISILGSLSSLQYLLVSDCAICPKQSPITPDLIHSLLWSNETDGMRLIPNLSRLKLVFHGDFFDDAAFVSTILSRWVPDPKIATKLGLECLRSVVLQFFRRKVDESVYEPLRLLDREGLRVVVTCNS